MAAIDRVLSAEFSSMGGREVNEDSLLTRKARGRLVMVVCDGLGGLGAGDKASRTAAEIAVGTVCGAFLLNKGAVERAVGRANAAVRELQIAENGRMMTTIALAVVRGGEIFVAHVGDTRAYIFRDGGILYQSVDHSASQAAASAGEITKDMIRYHSDRNILLKALGGGDDVKCDIFTAKVRRGDRLLLCSDGFWEPITEEEMLAAAGRTLTAGEWLGDMRATVEKKISANSDNLSAIAAVFE